jgi:hypothetical protein
MGAMTNTTGMQTADHNSQRYKCRLSQNKSISVAATMATPQRIILGSARLIDALSVMTTLPGAPDSIAQLLASGQSACVLLA